MSHPHARATLVMGARGSVGALVLDTLLALGVPTRASARAPRTGQFPADLEVVAADLTQPATLAPAFDGMTQVFLYAHHQGAEDVVQAARAAGIRKVVLMSSGSVIHPTSAGNSITEEHREVEAVFAAAHDLAVMPVRPLVLATNALNWARSIQAARSVAIYRPDALTAPTHEKDIAAVAVAALTGNDHPAVTGLLTGPARSSQRDQVAAIAAAIDDDITVTELDRDQAHRRYSQFMPTADAEAVLQFLDDAAAGNSPTTSTVADVLGRPATDFDAWAIDHADDFRWADPGDRL